MKHLNRGVNMLVEDLLLQRFKEETTGRNYAKGQRIINNDLVESVEIEDEEDLVAVNGIVISEQLFSKYSTKLEVGGFYQHIVPVLIMKNMSLVRKIIVVSI